MRWRTFGATERHLYHLVLYHPTGIDRVDVAEQLAATGQSSLHWVEQLSAGAAANDGAILE